MQTEYQITTQFQQLEKMHEHLNTNGMAFSDAHDGKTDNINPFFLSFFLLQEQPYVRKDHNCHPR